MIRRPAFLIPVALFALAAAGASAQTPPSKPKKVWTNEDIDDLRGRAGVSVVGASQEKQAGSTAAKAPRPLNEKNPAWYRKQLAPLHDEVEHINTEIRRMKEFLAGGHTGEGRLEVDRFSVPLNPADQILQLEKRRHAVEGKIEALLDQARRNGIAPGDLR